MATTIPVPAPSYTFQVGQQNRFTWTLTDPTGAPITGATVNSTLYSGRQINNAANYPGTPDTIFNNIPMPEAPALSGIYSAVIPITFNPSASLASAPGFVVVVTALSGVTPIGTWQTEAVIIPAGNAIDLVMLNDVKNWLDIAETNTDDDALLQILITSFSRYVLNRVSRDSFNIATYTEVYDGNGAQQLFLRNYPINSVTSVQIGSYTVPQSTSITSPGWFIDMHKQSLVMRSYGSGSYQQMVPYSIFPQFFYSGRGNIQVIYQAGHAFLPEDLYDAVMQTVGVMYARKDWKDLASKSLSTSGGGSGTTTYRAWHLTPGVEEVIRHHTRKALV